MKLKAAILLSSSIFTMMMPMGVAQAQPGTQDASPDRTVLPIAQPPFAGTVGLTAANSTPAFPPRIKAPKGAPNVILVMTDDVGFASSSTFGGLIDTPNLDRVAAKGLRYNNFNTTAMCSPSRAALLTGRNSHATGMGALTDFATGFPGYQGEISKQTATIAEILKQNGYSTAFFGKHHDVPLTEITTAGPFDNWPTGLGFEYFYGWLGSQVDQWTPMMYKGTVRVQSPTGKHVDELMADDAINWLHTQDAADPDKPFFLYLAPGTAHAPLQAPKEWIAKFKGKFDQGWDKAREEIYRRQKKAGIIPANAVLTPRPDSVQPWNSLTAEQKRIAAGFMEVYAGMLAHQDYQFGRLLAELERMGELENTLVIFVEGDNGSTPEGGPLGTHNDTGRLTNAPEEDEEWLASRFDSRGDPTSHAHYPRGWAWAMNTPFRYFKRYASHLGGIRNGMVMSWPSRFTGDGKVRTQFQHLIDVAPTILEAAQLPMPRSVNGVEQRAMDGRSMIATLASDAPPSGGRTQYFELLGNRGLYKDGWFASTTPPDVGLSTQVSSKPLPQADTYGWELYDLTKDFSQARDLAARNPEKLKELQDAWMAEARRNNVLPLDNAIDAARVSAQRRNYNPARHRYVYWGRGIELERGVAPPIMAQSFDLSASVTIPQDGGSGVLAAVGGHWSGWSFYLKEGRPVLHMAFSEQPKHQFRLVADRAVPPGPAVVSYKVRYLPDGKSSEVSILIDGKPAGATTFSRRLMMVDQGEPFVIGADNHTRVTDDYDGDGAFNGTIEKVVVELPDVPAQ